MNKELIPTENPGIFRDPSSGALINTDMKELSSYRAQRESIKNRKALEERVSRLEKEILELKSRSCDCNCQRRY